MKRTAGVWLLIALAIVAGSWLARLPVGAAQGVASGQAAGEMLEPLWLSDLESPDELAQRWKPRDATLERTEEHATHGRHALKVTFQPAEAPAAILRAGRAHDWSRYGSLRFDVYNPRGSSQRLMLQIKDQRGRRYKEEDLELKGERVTRLVIPLVDVRDAVDLRRVEQVSLFRWKPESSSTIYLDAVRLDAAGAEEEADGGQALPLGDAAVTPQRLGGMFFAQHLSRWQGVDPVTQELIVRAPLTLVSLGAPLSVGLPVAGGVPFAMGQLQSGAPIRLRDDNGQPWPAQTRTLATWEDGSVKWLDVASAIPEAARRRELWLEYGAPVQAPTATGASVRVEETPQQVTLSTGPLQCTVSKRRFTLFESAAVDRNQDGVFSAEERLAGPGDLLIRHAGRVFRSSADQRDYRLEVEERGPLRATLKASGWFRDPAGRGFCRFSVRLQAFAGLPQVRIYHTFVYTGYPANRYHHEYKDIPLPENETIEQIAIELPVTVAGEARLVSADEQGIIAERLAAPSVMSQSRADAYELRQGGATLRQGQRHEGWALVQNDTSGVMVALRDAWQQFPKALTADPDGRLTIELWPRSAGKLNLETGRESFGPDDVARGSAFGLGKTHELTIGFLGAPIDPETARSLASLWQEPWLLAPEPAWVQATDAWGTLGPVSWQARPQVEALLDGLFGWAQRQVRDFGWYGMLDYGDTRLWYRKEAYDKSYDEWGWHPEGRWGWHNCEAVGTHTGALTGFLRTLDPKYFRFGEAKARHVMDVDTVHYNTVASDPRLRTKIPDTFSKVGSIHRHSAYHWGGRNEEATHTHVLGFLMYYYLTGYDRALDVAQEVGSFLLTDPVTYTKHPDIAPLRGIANVLWGDVLLYEATHDRRYREAADRWVRVLLAGQRENGTWLETYNPRSKRWKGSVKTNYITLHAIPALIAYHRLTGNEQVAQAIVKATQAMMKQEKYLQTFDASAYSYRLTGQDKFLRDAQERVQALIESQHRAGDPLREGMVYDKIIYDRVAPILYTVPLLVGAMDAPDFKTLRRSVGVAGASDGETPEAIAPADASGAGPAAEAPYGMLVVPSLEKVLPERGGVPKGAHPNPAQLGLARNEYEAFQVVVRSPVALAGVTVEPGDLAQVGGSGVIPSEAITWSPVGFVKTKKPGYAVSHVGWWPDPLPGAVPFVVQPNWSQPIWVTVYAAPGTPAGEYRGRVVIRPANAAPQPVELIVTVWDFDLPSTPTLKSAFDVYPNRIESGYRDFFPQWWSRWQAQPEALAQRFYEMLLRYRLSPVLNMDLAGPEAVETLRRFAGQGLSAFGVGRRGGSFDNNWPDDPQELDALEPVYRAYASRLREAGLLDRHYVYTYDEPKPGLPKVARVAEMIHRADPALKNLVVLFASPKAQQLAGWLKPVDIVCLRNVSFDPAQAEVLRRMGKELWLYVSAPTPPYPTLVIDYPALAYRVLPWMCWKYGFSGLLYWSVNYWTTNPYENPMNTRWQQNGNGSLLYPGPEGPRPSIRMAVLRDGMEDYEYLARLRALADLGQARGADPALLARVEQLLAVDPALVASIRDYAEDPTVLEAQRRSVAELIESLQRMVVSNTTGGG